MKFSLKQTEGEVISEHEASEMFKHYEVMAISKHAKRSTPEKGKNHHHIRENGTCYKHEQGHAVLKKNHLKILNMNNVLYVVQNRRILWPAEDEERRNSYTSLKNHMDSALLYDMKCIKYEYHFSSPKQQCSPSFHVIIQPIIPFSSQGSLDYCY